MKKLISALLLLSFSVASFADCGNAYRVKAERRAKFQKNVKKTGMIVGGVAAAAGAAVLTPYTAIFTVPLLVGLGIQEANEIDETKKNNYFKGYAVIEGAKQGIVPDVLLAALDKKIAYYSMGSEEQNETIKKIVTIVNEGSASKELCPERKPLNFNDMVNFIADKVNE